VLDEPSDGVKPFDYVFTDGGEARRTALAPKVDDLGDVRAPRRRAEWPWLAALIALYICHLGINWAWLQRDDYPLIWDFGHQYRKAVRAYFYLSHSYRPLIDEPAVRALVSRAHESHPHVARLTCLPYSGLIGSLAVIYGGSRHPFFIYAPTVPFYALLGRSGDAAGFMNGAVFMGVLLVSMYAIGRRLASPAAGLVAAVIVGAQPPILGQSRCVMLDMPLAAMTSLSFYACLCTESFRHRRASTLFGVTLGLGVLTKEIFPVFMFAPFVVAAWRAWRARRADAPEAWRDRVRNIVRCVAVGIGISAVWWLPYFPSLYEQFTTVGATVGKDYGVPPWHTWDGATYYVQSLLTAQSSLPFVCLFLVCVVPFWRRYRDVRWPVAGWFAVPFAFFTMMSYKDNRFTVPYLPALALVCSLGVWSARRLWLRAAGSCLAAAYSLFLIWAVSFGTDLLPRRVYLPFGGGRLIPFMQDYALAPQPRVSRWRTDEIRETILGDLRKRPATGKREKTLIVVAFDVPEIEYPLRYDTVWDNMEVRYIRCGRRIRLKSLWSDPARAQSADYLLCKEGGALGPEVRYRIGQIDVAREAVRSAAPKMALLSRVPLPDGSSLAIYRNTDRT